jgi:predicted outer membrane protein
VALIVRQASSVSSRSAVAVLVTALLLGATPAAARAEAPSNTDLDFVRRVHLTVLSVGPASAQARQVSAHAAVKTLAAQVSSQNAELDSLARSTATALKVSLTSPLPAAQQAALTALQGHTGAVFETAFVNYLWAADSTLLPIAMTVRGTTRNAAVRRLAERADTVVAAQLPLLQKSGLLQMAVLPAPPASAAAARLPGGVPPDQRLEAQARSGEGFLATSLPVRLIVLAAALGAAGGLAWRLLGRPASTGRRRGRHHGPPRANETSGSSDQLRTR